MPEGDAPCEKLPGMLLLTFPEQVMAVHGEPEGWVETDAGWENIPI
jgi:hypothetical protein